MKKLLYIIPLIILLIIIVTVVLLFTPFGSNSFVKPLLNSYLAKKIEKPKINIIKLDSKFNNVDVEAIASNGVKLNSQGEVDYIGKKFDLDYHAFAKSVKVDDRDIKMDLDVRGQAVGSVKNFGVNGGGQAFDSDINYKFIIKDGNPQTITASLNSAQISKIFALANMQPIVDGLLTIDASIPSLNPQKPEGKASIDIMSGRFNQALIAKEYNIILPKNEQFVANLKTKVDKKYIISLGDINTTTAKIKIKKLTAALDFSQFKGYYRVTIDKLSRVAPMAKIPLKGRATFDGAVYRNSKRNITQLTAATNSFGGIAKLKLNDKKLSAVMKNISISKLLTTFQQPAFVSKGLLSGSTILKDYSQLNGKFRVASSGVLNKKLLKVALPGYHYSLKTEGSLTNGSLFARNTQLESHFIRAKLHNTRYGFLTGAVETDYDINIKDLSGIRMLTPIPLQGPLQAKGRFKSQANTIVANFQSNSLGGALRGEYSGNSLKSSFKGISLVKLLSMLQMPHYFNRANASGNIRVTDVTNGDGLFTVQSKGSIDTKSIQKLYDLNLSDPLNYSLLIKNGVLKQEKMLTRPQLLTSYGKFDFDYLNYDIKNATLSTKYRFNIDDLSSLNTLTGQKLQGSFAFNGEVKETPSNLLVTATAKELNGVINLMLKNDNLKLDAAGISVVQLLRMLSYDEILDGVAIANLDYNTKSESGIFKATIDEARFLNSALVQTLRDVAQFDLAQEVFSRANIYAKIMKEQIIFNLNTSSQKTKIRIKKGVIDRKEQTINARVVVTLNNLDYVFKLQGPLKKPRVLLSFSGQVQKKVLSVVKKAILGKDSNATLDKIIPKELKGKKLQEKIKKVIPKEIKGLFKNL